ncbi:SDR family oxidoreductase [Sulfurospirillum arcachonense]|uniref:SDR family oxidoreductase n=1 Tax=Sulfurospirillum arcachonense TaxID=57666 RepID=UPI000467ED96|nr:SDR family oxidoreductase [Sulfurospirillum arcachonense]
MSKIVLVTGATSGFGRETVKMFAKAGHKVIAVGRRLDKLDELKNELNDCDICTVSLDVRDKEAVFTAIESLPSEYKNIDILVNNAGLALGLEKAPDALLEDWEIMIDTNIKGLLYMTKAILPTMVERKSGYIFNLGSIAGNWPYEGGNVYGSTKSFVQQFSFNLRNDLKGTNIRVSNIEPGFSKTEFSNVRFKGDDEKANAIYDGMQPLVGEDIANLIFTLSQLPEHVNVNSLEVMPTAQTWAGFSIEKNT